MNYYAKQGQFGVEVKVHVFKTMQERDDWVKVHYDVLGARQCSGLEAKQLAKPEEIRFWLFNITLHHNTILTVYG